MAAPKTGRTAKKRPEDRLGHRTRAEQEATDYVPSEALQAPEVPSELEPNPEWHTVAAFAWKSFCESPLRQMHENTDFVHAWLTCELISRSIKTGMGPGQVMQLRMYLNDLGFTEAARRAIGVQITRSTEAPDPAKVVARERLEERRARVYGSGA
jgi:hypothetical protein